MVKKRGSVASWVPALPTNVSTTRDHERLNNCLYDPMPYRGSENSLPSIAGDTGSSTTDFLTADLSPNQQQCDNGEDEYLHHRNYNSEGSVLLARKQRRTVLSVRKSPRSADATCATSLDPKHSATALRHADLPPAASNNFTRETTNSSFFERVVELLPSSLLALQYRQPHLYPVTSNDDGNDTDDENCCDYDSDHGKSTNRISSQRDSSAPRMPLYIAHDPSHKHASGAQENNSNCCNGRFIESDQMQSTSTCTNTTKNHAKNVLSSSPQLQPISKACQLLIGVTGIYSAYLYYGLVQEDLFRYRSDHNGGGFTFVWALQVLESAVTMVIGYMGRKFCGGRDGLPLWPFFKSGASQLAAKALMSLSLAAGLSFPVVVLAKSAKIVPVMFGQLLMGGSSYSGRDYMFAILIVAGTSLLSAGNTTTSDEQIVAGSNSLTGLVLIFLSLTADGFTGGLQKKLKRVTASMAPTTYDFLYYSHMAQFCVAIVICIVTGEMRTAPAYLTSNPRIWWWIGATCLCSAVGQCFIFYVISCFDPVVCTTITTTRKMISVVFSISFKGHDLTRLGCIGLGLAVSALLLEVEGTYAKYRERQLGSVEAKQPLSNTTSMNNVSQSLPLVTPAPISTSNTGVVVA